jgi:uncharacterized protein YbaP (TraB family)
VISTRDRDGTIARVSKEEVLRARVAIVAWLACVACLAGSGVAVAQTVARGFATGQALEEVLVTGEHPGPGLWQVSNGENTLWILGTYEPLPAGLVWKSADVELVLTEAQQVLGNYSASFSLAGGDAFNTKGKPLRRLLSRRQYAQWQSLKRKYIGDVKEVETALPVTAALLLRSNAFARSGLASSDLVWRELHRLANNYHVPVTVSHQVNKTIANPSFDDAAVQHRGVDYLVSTMTNLEADLRAARARANAWAEGDLGLLRSQAEADKNSADLYANSWPFLTPSELAQLKVETDRRWVDAAARALRRNRTTFAALPIFLLLREDSQILAALREEGFVVESPLY